MSSPDEALQSAVTALLAKLEMQENGVRDTKKTVNTLLHHIGKPPMFPDLAEENSTRANLAVRPDQFYGRPLATGAREVLEARGQAMDAREILEVLERGGYDFAAQGWKEKDRLRSFAITLSKNVNAFHRLPNGFFGLPKWYPEAIKQRQSSRTPSNTTPPEEETREGENLEES
jgi:hypothetical protein